jgi:hypothetical protein
VVVVVDVQSLVQVAMVLAAVAQVVCSQVQD